MRLAKHVWLVCVVGAAAWLVTVAILTVVTRDDDSPRLPSTEEGNTFATEQLDGFNVGGVLLVFIVPAALVLSGGVYVAWRIARRGG